MKDIKLKMVGFPAIATWEQRFGRTLSNRFRQQFNIIECDHPDYAIFNHSNPDFEVTQYNCVRIGFSWECFLPDFNLYDYAPGYADIQFGDRYCRYGIYNQYPSCLSLGSDRASVDARTLESKECFCNFIYSAFHKTTQRADLFRALSRYKRVEAAGGLFNNMPDGYRPRDYTEKIDLIRKCKFTIAGENLSHPHYITEKITHAFAGQSIPIYLGAPDIDEVFNEKAFINGNSYNSLDEIVQEVIRLDNDDEAYLDMLRQPPLLQADQIERNYLALETFFENIFSQPPKTACRRSGSNCELTYTKRMRFMHRLRGVYHLRARIISALRLVKHMLIPKH